MCVCVAYIGCVIFYSWNSNFIKLWKYNYDVFTDIHLTNYWLFIIDLVMLYYELRNHPSNYIFIPLMDFIRNMKGKYCEKTFKCMNWYAVYTNENKHQLNLCSRSPFINATPLIWYVTINSNRTLELNLFIFFFFIIIHSRNKVR